jgi:hypothetical protein
VGELFHFLGANAAVQDLTPVRTLSWALTLEASRSVNSFALQLGTNRA